MLFITRLRTLHAASGKIYMSKKMLVNATHPEENRVAIVVDGILTELDIEVSGREPTKGNIYKAAVVRVEPGLQAAFVDYGAERLGFLQIDEVNATTVKPDSAPGENGKGRPRINELLHRGQEILVQITKEERGTKGAALTTYLSLAGRFMVCMPGNQTRGISRKVESDAERKQLKKAMASLDLPDDIGYIVRTAGLGKTQEELQRDFTYLTRLNDGIHELGKSASAPSLVYKESNLVIRSIRDYFTTEMDEVLIDDPDVFKEAKEFFQRVMPEHAGLVKLHQERRPIFSRYQIEDQIETISQNKVPLPSGGSIVIDQTEALVAIDVNSGKMTSEQGVEATAFKANVEAAAEVGRQLRLRDLGGLIVIDFIDMRDRKHVREVENTLKKSLENDKARVSIGRISSKFGLLEMSRQRIKAALTEGTLLTCPHCQGSGRIKSPESLAVDLMRRIHTGVAKGQIGMVDAQLPLDVASYLLNNKREELFEMERRHNLRIHIHGRTDFLTDQIEIEFQKREKEKPVQAEYVEAGTLPPQPETEAEEKKNGQEPNAETAEKPKKRRRRKRRKPASEKGEAGTVQAATEGEQAGSADEEPEQAPVEVDASQTQPETAETSTEAADVLSTEAEQKPKRKRSPRKKASPQPAAAEETPAETSTSSEAPAEPEQPTEAAPSEADAKPKRRRAPRRRTGTKHPDTVEQPETAPSAEMQEAAEKATEPTLTETEEKPKRRRAPRRKAADKAVEPTGSTEAAATGQEPQPPQPQAVEPAPVEDETKPKRRRAPRKKPVAKSAEGSSEIEATSAPAEVPAEPPAKTDAPAVDDESKPKPRRPARRRSPAKKPAMAQESAVEVPATTAPAGEEKPSQSAADATEAEVKPKRRRAPRKKAADKPPETE